MSIRFSEAIEQMEQTRDKAENAKLTLFISKNRDFLQQAFEDNASKWITVRLWKDIQNYDTFALETINELRTIKEKYNSVL